MKCLSKTRKGLFGAYQSVPFNWNLVRGFIVESSHLHKDVLYEILRIAKERRVAIYRNPNAWRFSNQRGKVYFTLTINALRYTVIFDYEHKTNLIRVVNAFIGSLNEKNTLEKRAVNQVETPQKWRETTPTPLP